jgi:hypothetical protein
MAALHALAGGRSGKAGTSSIGANHDAPASYIILADDETFFFVDESKIIPQKMLRTCS